MEKVETRKACPECGGTRLVRNYERAELVCAACGFIIHDKIMDMGPEWRAFDQEQRERRGRVGAPMTLSVDYAEPIIIERNGEMRVLPIGEFIDKLLSEAKEIKKDGIVEWADVEKLGYRTVASDKDYKINFRPIAQVSRHELYEDLYQVELEGGRKVLVTGAHSLYTVNQDFEVVSVKVEKLKHGDFVVAPLWVPTPQRLIDEIDLLKEFLRLSPKETKEFYLRHVSEVVFDELKGNGAPLSLLKNWKKYRILPLALANKFDGKIGSNVAIAVHGGKNEIPRYVRVGEKLCKLLGYYVSEGWVDFNDYVGFSFGAREKKYVKEVQGLLYSLFGLGSTVRPANRVNSALEIRVVNRVLAKLLTKILEAGGNAKEKRVPPIIFSLPAELKKTFLQAYICGDGCVYTKNEKKPHWRPITQLSTISANKALSVDILTLYSQLGIYAGYHEQEIPAHEIQLTGQHVNESFSTGTRLTNPDSATALGFFHELPQRKRKGVIENLVPAPIKYRKIWKCRKRIRINRELAIGIAKKFNDQKLLKLATAPFVFLRVKKIERAAPTSMYAYDISVPSCENFVITGKCIAHNTIHDKGLSTMIDWRDRDSHGKDLTPKRRAQIYRLRKWQRRIRVSDATERNLAFALSEVDRMSSHLALPRNVREAAALIYRKAVEERLIRGRSIEGVAAAALYAACRECKVPRTLDEIAEVSRVNKKEIGRSYRFIARELLIHLRPTGPIDYIPRFGSDLGLSGEVQSKAIELLKEATKKGLTSGRGPTGVAAAAIYIASVLRGERRTQRDVADVARVTEVTVRNRYKELCEKLGLDVEL